jgi:hypothetical protein
LDVLQYTAAGYGQSASSGFYHDTGQFIPPKLLYQLLDGSIVIRDLPMGIEFQYGDIEHILPDINADIPFGGSIVCNVDCVHNSPLLHSSSRLFRLFEFEMESVRRPCLLTG